jgi:hypothetical protein
LTITKRSEYGTDDDVLPIALTKILVDTLKKNGGDITYTYYEHTGHDAWTRTYSNGEIYHRNIPWKDNGIIDCALAMQNIMISAPTLGLGTVCVGGFKRKSVKEILGIPDDIEPIGMLYIGYPNECKRPRTKYLEAAVHHNAYDATRDQNPRPGDVIAFGPEASV